MFKRNINIPLENVKPAIEAIIWVFEFVFIKPIKAFTACKGIPGIILNTNTYKNLYHYYIWKLVWNTNNTSK